MIQTSFILVALLLCTSAVALGPGTETAVSNGQIIQPKDYAPGCSPVLYELSKRDAEASFFGVFEGRKRACDLITKDEKYFADAYQLESELSSRYSPNTLATSSTPRACAEGRDGKYRVAKFYYNQARLEAGEKKLVQELGELSRFVPNDVPLSARDSLSEAPKVSSSFPEVQKLADEIKKCGPPGQDPLNKEAEALLEADTIITTHMYLKIQLDDAEQRVREQNESFAPSKEYIDDLKSRIEKLAPLVEPLKQRYPWLAKDTFRKALNQRSANEIALPSYATDEQKKKKKIEKYRSAILAQTREEQENRIQQLKTYNEVNDCLIGKETSKDICGSARVMEIMRSTPPIDTGPYRDGRTSTATQYLEAQECVHDGKEDQAKITRQAYIDALSIGAAGFTGLLSVGKGAIQIANAIKSGKTVKQAYQAQAVSELGIAGKVIVGVDIGVGSGIVAAEAATCVEERKLALTKLEQPKTEFQCKESDLAQAVSDLHDCELLATAAIVALPFVGFAAGPLSRKLASLRNAKASPLSRLEDNALASTRALEEQLQRNNLVPSKYYACINNEKDGCPNGLQDYLTTNNISRDEAARLRTSANAAIKDRNSLAALKAQDDLRLLGNRVESRDYNCRRLNAVYTGAFNTNVPCQQVKIKQEIKGEYCACGDGAKPGAYLSRCAANANEFLSASIFKDRLALPTNNQHSRCFRVTIPAGATCYNGGNGATLAGLGGGSQLLCSAAGLTDSARTRFKAAVARGEIGSGDIPDLPVIPGGLRVERWSPFTENFPDVITAVNRCIGSDNVCPKPDVRRIYATYAASYTEKLKRYQAIKNPRNKERKIRQLEKEREEFKAYFRDLETNGVAINPPSSPSKP
jgi:hypothetical protein